MLHVVILLAQVATPTPSATPTAAYTPVSSRGRTLSDFALERKLGKPSSHGTFSISGSSTSSDGNQRVPDTVSRILAASDQQYASWKARADAVRAELAAAQQALVSMEALMPDAYSYGRYGESQREQYLRPYRERVEAAERAVAAIPEQARQGGAPPGALRDGGK